MKFTLKLTLLIFILNFSFQNSKAQDLDLSFGINGKSFVDIGNKIQTVNTVLVQSDGKILVCGNSYSSEEYFVMRFNTNGSLDNTFNSDGIVNFTIPSASNGGFSHSMALQSDGKILIGGEDYDGINVGAVIVRLDTDGTFDNTFGVNGFLRFPVHGINDKIESVLVMSSGKFYTIGTAYTGSINEVFIARFNSDGSFDTSYDTDGIANITGSIINNGVKLQSDDKLILVNSTSVKRIDTDGSIDNSFGTAGVVTLTGLNIRSLSMLSSGKIILAGDSINYFGLAKLNTDGSLDNTFGSNGKKYFTPSGLENSGNIFNHVMEDPATNNIIATGRTYYPSLNIGFMAIVELLANGTVDNYTTINNGLNQSGNISVVNSAVIQSDRKIVLAGVHGDATNDDVVLVRLNADFSTIISTGITNESLLVGINLFPNPASHNINIHSSYEVQNIKVIDILGNELLNQDANGNTQLDISALPKGLYNFVISTDRGIATKKISIQ